jgi:hypothetical protein
MVVQHLQSEIEAVDNNAVPD